MVGEFAGLGFTEHVREVVIFFGYIVQVDRRFGSSRMTGNLGMRNRELETFRALEFACTGVARGIDEGYSRWCFWFYRRNGFLRFRDCARMTRKGRRGRKCLGER